MSLFLKVALITIIWESLFYYNYKSWAEVASEGSKGKNLDKNVLATEVARKVNKEITDSKKSDLDIGDSH